MVKVYGKRPTRDGFGEGVLELGRKNKNIMVLCADLTDSTRAGWFKKEFPDRFIACGVAEQDMMGIAAGLALMGKIPFACSFGVFASGRAWDQVRVSVAYMNLNVKIIGTHGGISVGPDGATHQALEEITLMRALPNMTVLVPCDQMEAKKATIAAASYPGPVYIRLGRSAAPIITQSADPFKIGKANVFKEGKDITIIACGYMVHEALLASKQLEREGIKATVINLHTIKPLDKNTILKSVKKTGCALTCEEHSVVGGMGSAVLEMLSEECHVPLKRLGIQDRFGESGDSEDLFKAFGLTPKHITKAAKAVIKLKK